MMDARPQVRRRSSPRHPRRGATLLAAAVGVFALGVALSIAIPVGQNAVGQSRARRIAGELRRFTQALEVRAREDGRWPAATRAPGEMPAGVDLGPEWSRTTPLGLRFLWIPDSLQRGRRYRAAIMLWRDQGMPNADERQLLVRVDREIDDGNLQSGKFQLGHRDQAFLVLEP